MMRNLLMALAFLGLSSVALACPCKQAAAGCPDCGKTKVEAPEGYKGKEIVGGKKVECEKCAKKDTSGVKKD
ncbi:hypothetical protein [Persephonella sp.]